MLYMEYFNASLSAHERTTLFWRADVISECTPLGFAVPISSRPDDLLYTDAAANPPCICALLSNPNSSVVRPITLLVAFARPWIRLFKATCLIFGLELLALVAFFEDSPCCSPSDQFGSTWTTIIVRRLLRGATLTWMLFLLSLVGFGIPSDAAEFLPGFPEPPSKETRPTCPRGRNGRRRNRGARPHLNRPLLCLDWPAHN